MRAAIIGGGFSGTMTAVQLVRASPAAEAVLIEKSGRFGLGAAYSTDEPGHLLNVRARNMSALPDDPGHFARWAEAEGLGGPDSYVPRRDYGRYLKGLLAEAEAGGRLRRVSGEAAAWAPGRVSLASGDEVVCDAAVLAGGNYPGRMPVAALDGVAAVDDPWGPEGVETVRRLAREGGDVLLLGTGLTMVDMAVTLEAAGFEGRITALSRRGLTPRAHLRRHDEPLPFDPPARLGALVRAVRGGTPWRAAVDALRPHSVALWRGLSIAEKKRFLRHLRPWWDVHRHRIAPDVADRIAAMQASGKLETLAARIVGAEGGEVTIARRGGGIEKRRVNAAINCTGPEGAIARVHDPLVRQLIAAGEARPDALGIGLEVDAASRLIRADGAPSPALYAIGPLSKGAFWEIVAVPDIRGQAQAVARALAG